MDHIYCAIQSVISIYSFLVCDPETPSQIASTPALSQKCPLVRLDRASLEAPFEAGDDRWALLLPVPEPDFGP